MSKEFSLKTNVTYDVEMVWFDSDKPENEKWARYSAFAFTDSRSPGSKWEHLLVNTNPELFDKRRFGKHGEIFSYDKEEDAIEAAEFLSKFAHTTAGYEGQEEWRLKYRGIGYLVECDGIRYDRPLPRKCLERYCRQIKVD